MPADTQDFFDDDLDDLLDDDVIQFQNFTSDEEYLILDAPGDYSIVTRHVQHTLTSVKCFKMCHGKNGRESYREIEIKWREFREHWKPYVIVLQV